MEGSKFARDVIGEQKHLAFVRPEQSCFDAARLMKQHDVGAVPIVRDESSRSLEGIITDRDICVGVVAEGKDARSVKVSECMTKDVCTARPDASLDDIARLMRDEQVRRIPIVDEQGKLVGIVAQKDIAQNVRGEKVGETVAGISREEKPMHARRAA